ncbi:LAQU0S18e01992g1_1 [Lachancea quebecensis]|uniref:LAQU0S18e01992g1_1 n=1 Tax=Lachancea quebecensis TaxID=1654605 RepID=A0A0P1KXR6_9SACH|nr:LAQU0S18e01992g1_1 [Lachancea quebecensis]
MSRIARQLKFLNKISSSTLEPQVVLNPQKYAGLNLTFQYQNHNGHMGARKFWHEYLPTLQFYNPGLQFQVTRVKNEDKNNAGVPCILQTIGKDGSVLETLDMRNKQHPEIMQELLEKADYEKVPESDIVRV